MKRDCRNLLHNRMLKVKNVGRPDEGKPHVRFDEEGQVSLPFTLLLTCIVCRQYSTHVETVVLIEKRW